MSEHGDDNTRIEKSRETNNDKELKCDFNEIEIE